MQIENIIKKTKVFNSLLMKGIDKLVQMGSGWGVRKERKAKGRRLSRTGDFKFANLANDFSLVKFKNVHF